MLGDRFQFNSDQITMSHLPFNLANQNCHVFNNQQWDVRLQLDLQILSPRLCLVALRYPVAKNTGFLPKILIQFTITAGIKKLLDSGAAVEYNV